jgi:hypothetical protein
MPTQVLQTAWRVLLAMNVAVWAEFFLRHEAHHLYLVMTRLR